MQKSITICIPTNLNNVDYFVELLRSIANQTMLPDYILIVLSGKNKTKRIFEKLINNISELIPKNINPEFIILDSFGLSYARNIGINHCKTDILIFGDDDDLWDKNKIYLIHQTCLKNGICLIRHRFNNLIENKVKNSSNKYKLNSNIFLIGVANFAGGGSSLSGSTCIFKTIRFNENLFGCEDWDFWIRAYLIGVPIINIKKELVTYRVHSKRMTNSLITVSKYENMVRFRYLKKIFIFMIGLIVGFLRLLLKYILVIFPSFFIEKINKNNRKN